MRTGWVIALGLAMVAGGGRQAAAEGCTTQSQMKPGDRDALAAASREIALKIQSGDAAGLQGLTIAEYAKDFAGIRSLAADTAQHLRGNTLTVDQVYLLDGSQIKTGNAEPAQFFCSLNQTQAAVDFTIPGLTPGVYGFAIVDARGGATPWRLPLLLRQDGGRWLLAGFYPRPTQAAGHDGVWYWREARRLAAEKQLWNAWLYYEEAIALLRPANFVQTTHLEKLTDEQRTSTPPALSGGISADVPLVVHGAAGEFRITSLAPDDPLGKSMLDVAIHTDAGASADAPGMRTRSDDAAEALIAAYPEIRKQFGGVFVTLDRDGRGVFTIERPMAEIR